MQFVFFWAEVSKGSTGVGLICGPCRGVSGQSVGAVGMLCKLLAQRSDEIASYQSLRTLCKRSALERSEMKRNNMFSHLLSVVWTWWVKGSHDCWLTLLFLCRTTEADSLTDATMSLQDGRRGVSQHPEASAASLLLFLDLFPPQPTTGAAKTSKDRWELYRTGRS